MGGRGRGRGGGARAAMSFNVEELGFRRGDALPVSQLAPPPLFPAVATRPAPFEETEELKYLQVGFFKGLTCINVGVDPIFLPPTVVNRDVLLVYRKFQESSFFSPRHVRRC